MMKKLNKKTQAHNFTFNLISGLDLKAIQIIMENRLKLILKTKKISNLTTASQCTEEEGVIKGCCIKD